DVLKHYTGKKPLFSSHQLEEQIDRVYGRKVPLPSGGALVLDQTEALVAIDVNSGKTSGDGVEDMAFKTNMEAAEEVARQLRLRDLAGLIAIDFIDMKRESHIRSVQDCLVDCLKADKARMEVGKINRFGVLVMTRQRIRPSLQHVNHETCPTCTGTGKVKTLEALVLSVVRRIHGILAKGGIGEIRVKLAPAIAAAVLNQKRRELNQMEEQSEARVIILADWSMGYGEMAAEIERAEEAPAEKPAPKPPREKGSKEEETVVLGGDSPISFEKALGEPAKDTRKEGFKYDRRDLQRAALDERERLRALFESAKPEDDESEEAAAEAGEEAKGDGVKRKRRRRRRKGAGERSEGQEAGSGASQSSDTQDAYEAQPEPPRLSADLVASLLTPSPRPRIGAAPAAPVAEVPKPRRTPRAKVSTPVETAPPAPPAPAPAPEAPARKKPGPKPKPKAAAAVETAPKVTKVKAEKPAAKAPKAPVAKKAAPAAKAPKAKKAKSE
ncbi:MAG: ribonuclease E/G, partial [Acidobacteria bacterium]|nr:ribonuclease E/G [Acidobacteriota bacterium]